MPEPTTTAIGVSTFIGAAVSTTAITAFGVPLGLRADVLVAGFAGALAGIILLGTVPGSTDTWPLLCKTTLRRMLAAGASSATAGYLTPLTLLIANVPAELLLSMSFVVGGGAQHFLSRFVRRFAGGQDYSNSRQGEQGPKHHQAPGEGGND